MRRGDIWLHFPWHKLVTQANALRIILTDFFLSLFSPMSDQLLNLITHTSWISHPVSFVALLPVSFGA